MVARRCNHLRSDQIRSDEQPSSSSSTCDHDDHGNDHDDHEADHLQGKTGCQSLSSNPVGNSDLMMMMVMVVVVMMVIVTSSPSRSLVASITSSASSPSRCFWGFGSRIALLPPRGLGLLEPDWWVSGVSGPLDDPCFYIWISLMIISPPRLQY